MLFALLQFAPGLYMLVAFYLSNAPGLSARVHRLSRLAEGDLSVDYMARGGDEIGQLINALNDARAQLKILIRQIRSSSQSIDTAAEGIAQTNSALSIRELPQSQSV